MIMGAYKTPGAKAKAPAILMAGAFEI